MIADEGAVVTEEQFEAVVTFIAGWGPNDQYKPCLSGGREVHWRKIDEETYEAHDGSGKIATGPWERFQAYLDGKTGWPG